MSDLQRKNKPRRLTFRLGQIAPYLEKDARTLRRWCEMDLVPGARRTRGGHWRIRGTDRASVLSAIRSRVSFGRGDALAKDPGRKHRARLRRENAYPPTMGARLVPRTGEPLTPRQAWARLSSAEIAALSSRGASLTVSKESGRVRWRNVRHKSDRARALIDAVAWLREQRDDLSNPWSREHDKLFQQSQLQSLIANVGAEKAAMVLQDNEQWENTGKAPRITVGLLAEILGISERTFYRWFPGWRRVFFNETAEDLEYGIVGQDDDGTLVKEPLDPAPEPGADMAWD